MERYVHSSDRDEIFAASLVRVLRGCDDARKWRAIRLAADDRSPLVRAAAVEALGDDTDRASVAALVEAATDEYRLVRVRAAEALAGMPADLVSPAARRKAERALAEYVASLQARPDDAGARADLGRYRLRQGELEKAVRNFETAVRLRQDHAAYRVELGRALEALERPVDAADSYRAALETDPDSAEAAYRLGTILGADFPSDGLRWFRRAAEIRPREPRYAFAVAVALRESGGTDEAIVILNEMIEDHPGFADAWFALGEAYEERGQRDTARGVYLEGSENERLPDDARRRLAAKVRRP
jgi:tetratricopeptide (TPR) repeat protein